MDNFNQPPTPSPEKDPNKEGIERLKTLFGEAESVFEKEGRESAKLLLPKLYEKLQQLNKSDKFAEADYGWLKTWEWNPEGDLTQKEFDELNIRRKKLSNAIGILTKDGTIRHALNPDVE